MIDGGTLAVQEFVPNKGELFSRTIEVASGAIFDISSFTEYELQLIESGLGQVLSGAGTVDLGGTGSTLVLFSDSTISPGDRNGQNVLVGTNSIGTLTIDGDVSDSGGSTFLMEIAGDVTNDRVDISGTASLNGTIINVTGVPTGPISNGTVPDFRRWRTHEQRHQLWPVALAQPVHQHHRHGSAADLERS